MALLSLDFVDIPLLSFDIHCFFVSLKKKERTKTSPWISLIANKLLFLSDLPNYFFLSSIFEKQFGCIAVHVYVYVFSHLLNTFMVIYVIYDIYGHLLVIYVQLFVIL